MAREPYEVNQFRACGRAFPSKQSRAACSRLVIAGRHPHMKRRVDFTGNVCRRAQSNPLEMSS